MKEEDFREELKSFLMDKLVEWKLDNNFEVSEKQKILTDFTISESETKKFMLYAGFLEQDIAILFKNRIINLKGDIELYRSTEIKVPIAIIELKLANNFNVHHLITYSAIASKIKVLFPYCHYFMVVKGERKFRNLTLNRHAKSLKVFDDWDTQKDQLANKLKQILESSGEL